ncbi:extensin family protein [Salipiger abyssi]|uniref:extensin-like domain-containing protein n=1 Tax=Salipiger abyssi TaxID=1250539 RepID=UPI001A8BF8E1|nr:extensin family protein [Salipiger abyssi]MBN9885959.1 extensin family protein [Salipiger abyssi]
MRAIAVSVMLAVLATQSPADAPESSLRPPLASIETASAPTDPMIATAPRRPEARPVQLERLLHRNLARELRAAGVPGFVPEDAAQSIARARAFAARSPQAVALSPRPSLRPVSMVQDALARQRERIRGAVCGDPDLQGETIGFVPGRISACGLRDAIELRSVSGVRLSQKAVIDCTTARALKRWVERGVKPAVGRQGGGVAGLRVAAHYACRTRNNQPGAKVSEHGKGRAIDIAAIRLRDGSEMNVLQHWGSGDRGRALRQMHKAACGPFGTVLGPGSDGFHRDHIHLDTARYRSGSYCR